MTDDSDRPGKPGAGDLEAPFLFVPHDSPEPAEWKRRHPGWVRFPATFVPHAPVAQRTVPGTNQLWPLDKRGQPWPRSRFGQPLRPLDEYPPGVRAPGEAYTGPIADPARAVESYREFMAAGGMGTYDPDPDGPAKAYLRSRGVLGNPGRGAEHPPRGAPAAVVAEAPAGPPPGTPPPRNAPGADGGPEAIPAAAPFVALGAGVAAALLGGALGAAPPLPGAPRPGVGGRGARRSLAPLPGFSVAPPPAAAEGFGAGAAGPLKLPTPAVPERPRIEHGPAVDADQGPHVVTMASPWPGAEESFSIQKQDGHIVGTPQHRQRLRTGRATSTFDVDREQAYELVEEAWARGAPVPGRPGLRDYDFGRRIGTAPDGRGRTKIRVHQDTDGRLHGHPAGN